MNDTRPEARLYAVMTDSHRPFDKTVLARMPPARTRASGFWTEDDPDAVWLMNRDTGEEVLSGLSLNNPRIVRAEKAVALITAQRDAKLAPVPEEDEPLPDGP
jgi:hypothetical protein